MNFNPIEYPASEYTQSTPYDVQLELAYKAQESKTNHILHFLVSLIFLPWIVVWLVCAGSNGSKNKALRAKLELSFSQQ